MPGATVWPAACFCTVQKLRTVLLFFDGWESIKGRIIFVTYEIQIQCQKKVLLELSHTHLSMYCLWMLLHTMAEFHSFEDRMSCKAQSTYYQVFTEKVVQHHGQHFILVLSALVGRTAPDLGQCYRGKSLAQRFRDSPRLHQKSGVLPHLPYCEAVSGG